MILSPLSQRAIVLGLLIAIIAFAIDLYMPSFVVIAREFHTDIGVVQQSMTSFLAGMGVGQVIYGPISDGVGRKRPIYVGMVIFLIGSVAAAFAPSVEWLIAARLLQGLGAGAAAVIPMAVIRDEYTGPDAARLMSQCMLALSVSPILAPVAGGLLVQVLSWRVIFGVLIVLAGAALVMVMVRLPETHPVERRVSIQPLHILQTYGRLLRAPRFLAPIGVGAFAQGVLLAFISGASFVYVSLFHFSPTQFGLIFAVHASVLIGISQFNGAIMERIGSTRLLFIAASLTSLAGLALSAVVLAGLVEIIPFMGLSLAMFAGVGLMMAPAFMVALEPFGDNAGAAAALGSGLETAVCSLMVAIMAASADGTARPLVLFMTLSAVLAVVCWAWHAWLGRAVVIKAVG